MASFQRLTKLLCATVVPSSAAYVISNPVIEILPTAFWLPTATGTFCPETNTFVMPLSLVKITSDAFVKSSFALIVKEPKFAPVVVAEDTVPVVAAPAATLALAFDSYHAIISYLC